MQGLAGDEWIGANNVVSFSVCSNSIALEFPLHACVNQWLMVVDARSSAS